MPTKHLGFDAFLAKMPDAPSATQPRKNTDEKPEDAASGENEESPEDGESGEESGEESREESREESEESPEGEDVQTRILEALKSGDIDTLADLLDEDPGAFHEKAPKWLAAKKRQKELKTESEQVLQRAEQVVERWLPVEDLVAQVEAGDFSKVPDLVNALVKGHDYDSLVLKVARARAGQDPRVPELQKQLKERDERLAKADSERAARAEREAIEQIRDETSKDSLVRKLDGWESLVLDELRASYDDALGEPSLSIPQAVKRTLRKQRDEYERRAKLFGGGASAIPPKTPERAAGATGAPIKRMTREEFLRKYSQ